MKKTIVLTVALATGLTAFAANAAEFPNIERTPLFSSQKNAAKAARTADKPNRREAAKPAKLAGGKPVIQRTPLFATPKTQPDAEEAKPLDRNDNSEARKTGRGLKAGPASNVKSAGLNVRKARAGAAKNKRSTMILEVETATGYAVKPDLKAVAAPAGAGPYHAVIARYAAQYGVAVSLAHAVISVESNYRPNTTGSAGEVGLMQIKPATARGLGYSGSTKGLYDVETNIRYGMQYLAMAQQLGGGTTCGTILKYNAGHGASRMNPVSRAYCGKVQKLLAG